MIRLTRCYRFPAAHVLAQPELSAAENRRIYGKCANPGGHGHNYGIEITLAGEVDPHRGQIVAPEQLDAIFERRIGSRFGHRMLNDDPHFAERVPTAENIAAVVHAELADEVASLGPELVQVRVVETRRNSFAYADGDTR